MAEEKPTHILPEFPTFLPGMKPEDHLNQYHLRVRSIFTRVWQKIEDQQTLIKSLQDKMKGQ